MRNLSDHRDADSNKYNEAGLDLVQLTGSTNNQAYPAEFPPSESLVEQIFKQIPTAIAYLDGNYKFIRVSQAFAQADQRSPEDYPGKNFFDLYPAWDNRSIFDQVMSSGEPYEATNQSLIYFERPGHPVTFWNWSLHPIENLTGEVAGLILTLTNVTEHNLAATALNESQEMFARLFEAAPDANVLIDEEGNILAVNQQTERVFGYDRTELIGKPIDILLPKRFHDHRSEINDADPQQVRMRSMGIGLDQVGRKKNRTEFPVDVTLSPIKTGEKVMVIAVIRDISRRKKIEKTLKDQATLLKLLQDVAFAANEAVSIESAVQFALDAICDYTGWPVGHALQVEDGSRLSSMRLWHMKDLEKYSSFMKLSEKLVFQSGEGLPGQVLQTGKPAPWADIKHRSNCMRSEAAMEAGLISTFAFPLMVGKEVAGVLEFFSDKPTRPNPVILGIMSQIGTQLGRVIERSQAETELLRSEARFRTIFEESVFGIKLIDLEGKILASNPTLQAMLGYSGEELDGMGFTSFTYPSDVPANLEQFRALIRGEIDHFKMEKRYIRSDGKIIWGRLGISAVHDEAGKVQFAIGMVEDITRRKEMETELTEVQRRLLESTEAERLRLAQDLHDGPIQDLYGVNFKLQEIENEISEQSRQNGIGEVRSSLQQVISMLRYTCGELRPPTLVPFGLEKAIRSHAEHFSDTYPEIKVTLDLESDGQRLSENARLGLFRIYQQLLSNVIRHAQATKLDVRLWLDESNVTLEVADNGKGFNLPRRWIDLARQGHLGLVGASERAEAIGGKLDIQSAPGKGATIRAVAPLGEK